MAINLLKSKIRSSWNCSIQENDCMLVCYIVNVDRCVGGCVVAIQVALLANRLPR
jgi:hypothetical protein